MKPPIRYFLALLPTAALWGTLSHSPAPQHQKFATVTLNVLDSFGLRRPDCSVAEFVLQDDDGNLDFRDHFTHLVGRDIPYGSSYRVRVKCADDSTQGPFLISVTRANEFRVLGAWLHRGDYVTATPRLKIFVARNHTEQSHDSWVDLVGVYLHTSHTDSIDPDSGEAAFYNIVPGRYIVLLLNGEKLTCLKQIDFVEVPARLQLYPANGACTIKVLSGARLID